MSLTNAAQTPGAHAGVTISDPPPEIPRDRWGRPLIVPRGGGKPKPYVRASTLGGTLEDQYGLGEWRKRVVVLGMGRRRDLFLAAKAIKTWDAHEDKKALAEIAEKAMEAAEADAAATIGTALHAMTQRLDEGETIPDLGEDRYALDAYADLMSGFVVHGMEQFVVCDEAESAGTFDRLLSPRNVMIAPDGTVITPEDRLIDDLKTSATADYFGIKFAVQLAIYAHGEPYVHGEGRRSWPDGIAPRTDWGLIMHVPSGGSSAEPYWVNLRLGWELAQLAGVVRDWRKRRDLVVPAQRPTAPMDAALNSAGLLSLIAHAPGHEQCKELWRQHKSLWTAEHTKAVEARLAELTTTPSSVAS